MKTHRSTSNKGKRADGNEYQQTLFPGSLDVDIRIRSAVSEAIRISAIDRCQIVAEMSRLTGIDLTKSTLDNWSSESRAKASEGVDHNGNKRWGIPAEMIPAFCEVTGDFKLIEILATTTNHRLLKSREVVQLELERIKRSMDRLAKKEKELEATLQEGGAE